MKELFLLKDYKLDSKAQKPMLTGTVLDELFSIRKGIMPATITMMPGEAGMGKTTVCIEILKHVKKQDPDLRVLFISVEMNEINLYRYSMRLNFDEIPIFLFNPNSKETSVMEQFYNILDEGWHLVVLDSFQQTVNLLAAYESMSTKKAEVKVIETLDFFRKGNNKRNLYTSFIATMHMTKNKSFTGSAYIKYMIDAMLELHRDKEDEFLSYMTFSKNREGKTKVRLYYNIEENGINYNLGRYREDQDALRRIHEVEEEIDRQSQEFDNLFNL